MSPSNGTLIDELKNVVFAKVDVEYQNISTIKEVLPHLVNQDSTSDVKTNFLNFRNVQSASSKKM